MWALGRESPLAGIGGVTFRSTKHKGLRVGPDATFASSSMVEKIKER